MNSHKNIFSWKETLQINYRAFMLIYNEYPQMFISKLVTVIWKSVTPYITIFLSALIINELATANNPKRLKQLVVFTLVSSALVSLVSAFLSKWEKTYSGGEYFKLDNILSKKMMSMDFVSIDDTKTHELLSKIRQTSNGWGMMYLIRDYGLLISSVFTILGGITLTVSLFTSKVPTTMGKYTVLNNPIFIFLFIVIMLFIVNISPILRNKAYSYWAITTDKQAFGNRLFSYYGAFGYKKEIATDIRIYKQDILCDKYNHCKDGVFFSKGLLAKMSKGILSIYCAIADMSLVILSGIVYLFVGLKAWAGAFGVGMVTQYVISITKVAGGLSDFIEIIGRMKTNASFLTQIFEFMDIPNTMYQGTLTVEKRSDRNYEIEFKNVSFKYPNTEIYALRNLNMKFKVGSKLAVVGMNGSGKTTFIKLLCRLYDPTDGEILLNGIDIRKYNYLDYMMIFSVVFQDFALLSLTLGENVASTSDYDKERVIDCLQKAGFTERLDTLKDGINTYLYKNYDKSGIDISGGEAQKIAIARTLYKNAPFIVLDEPTAALDPIAEAEIYSKFNDIAGDKTTIYISHRLSSCKFCDEIAVFDNGAVIQMGNHETLLNDKSGKYYELWNAQAQYYTDCE